MVWVPDVLAEKEGLALPVCVEMDKVVLLVVEGLVLVEKSWQTRFDMGVQGTTSCAIPAAQGGVQGRHTPVCPVLRTGLQGMVV